MVRTYANYKFISKFNFTNNTFFNYSIYLVDYNVKMDAPDFTLDLHEKDICEVLRQLIVRYYDDIESKEMELEIDIPDEAIYVKVDEKNLFRALGNLVDGYYFKHKT